MVEDQGAGKSRAIPASFQHQGQCVMRRMRGQRRYRPIREICPMLTRITTQMKSWRSVIVPISPLSRIFRTAQNALGERTAGAR